MNKPLCVQMEEEINAVIDRYRDQGITYGENIGILECVKLNLWYEQQRANEEDINDDDTECWGGG